MAMGRHTCACGRVISNSALARAAHERSAQCALDCYWRGMAGQRHADVWHRVRRGTLDPDVAYSEAVQLARLARAVR